MSSRVQLTCPNCGRKFIKLKSIAKRLMSKNKNQLVFCSRECSTEWHKKRRIKQKEKRKCVNCGKDFEVEVSSKRKFCSSECSFEWMSRNRKGDKNPNWKPKKIVKCFVCGKEFETYLKLNRRFCSWRCWLKYLKKIRKISSENRKKMVNSLLKRPTKPEEKLIGIIKRWKLPFKYVGNGMKIIGGLNPDFINEKRKQIIEVFGDYWHNPKFCRRVARQDVRKAIFLQQGYRTLIIWEHELKNEEEVLKKIEAFMATSIEA